MYEMQQGWEPLPELIQVVESKASKVFCRNLLKQNQFKFNFSHELTSPRNSWPS